MLDQAKEPREGPGVGGVILWNGEADSEKGSRAALKFVNKMEEGERVVPRAFHAGAVGELGKQ